MSLSFVLDGNTKSERAARDLLDRVRLQQMDMSLRLASFTLAVTFGVVQVVVAIFWSAHSHLYLASLETIILALSAIAFPETWRWKTRPQQAQVSDQYANRVFFFALVYGCALGSIPVALFIPGNPVERTLIASTCAGLIATGVSLAVTPRIAIAYSGPIVVASFLALAGSGESYNIYVAILLAFYSAFLLFLVLHFSRLVASRVLAQVDLERQQQLTNLLLNDFEEGASDWLWETDAALRLEHASARLIDVARSSQHELQGMPLEKLFGAHTGGEKDKPNEDLRLSIAERREFRNIIIRVRPGDEERWWSVSGKPILDEAGAFVGYRGVGSDVTETKRSADQLSYLAMNDSLTGLPNRASFQTSLEESTRKFADGEDFCLFCLDLDGFKGVNDTFGHWAGDQLLQAVARRLGVLVETAGATLARLAGDEFVIILSGVRYREKSEIAHCASGIVAAIGAPFQIGELRVNIGVSIGIALASQSGVTDILRRADMALYRVKQAGRGDFCFYEREMDENIEARRALIADLRGALGRNEFFLNFQPLVNAKDGRPQGFEALVRWRHPTRGLVPPNDFIRLAEESGAIFSIGEWIIGEACRVAAEWPKSIVLAVNLSPIQFRHSNLPRVVSLALEASGLAPHRLELEVTESLFLDVSQTTKENLAQFRALGVRLSLDDFGTGYSSLSYLRRVAFDKIKIDQAFVRDLPHQASDLAIVRSVVQIAATLGMTVTAEGVETEAQRVCLLQNGCDELQGYLFSKPLSETEAARFLAEHKRGGAHNRAA